MYYKYLHSDVFWLHWKEDCKFSLMISLTQRKALVNACVKPIPPTGETERKGSITMLKSGAMKENKKERPLAASLGRWRTSCRSNCVQLSPSLFPPNSKQVKSHQSIHSVTLHRMPREMGQRGNGSLEILGRWLKVMDCNRLQLFIQPAVIFKPEDKRLLKLFPKSCMCFSTCSCCIITIIV